MAYYQSIRRDRKTYPLGNQAPGQAGWIAQRLLRLRAMLNGDIISRRDPNSLIVGSWNIKHFDGGRKRLPESYHYIAEIIDHFDICAIQEAKDMEALRRLKGLLGPNWDFFVNDQTTGHAGNDERMAYFFNRNKVRFNNLIGELVYPRDELLNGEQPSRTPFFASFQAGWFHFTLCSAHIVSEDKPGKPTRQQEIALIGKTLKERAEREDEVHIFMGDFNQDDMDDAGLVDLKNMGYVIPDFGPTNLGADKKHFDHITFIGPQDEGDLMESGRVDWHEAVYTETDRDAYQQIAAEIRDAPNTGIPYNNWSSFYSRWRTDEMSDHLPIWIEIRTDYSNRYLRAITELGNE
ncbi:endonuclease/exonuclease/phosphatase family protein [Parvularcula marina]|uniref:Endonuclease/exonuclease/phosphatase domain-containing protein n=1 Tax=Parvularcula marina TaxID=2292771 RepID=A0A371RGU7_9PROT|nr:endonuclease/exonuclease/phosphatase family protein [Parvularcula marina]RFB04669.1 hypothetical protein DX908_04875 [Parvularcula marina]